MSGAPLNYTLCEVSLMSIIIGHPELSGEQAAQSFLITQAFDYLSQSLLSFSDDKCFFITGKKNDLVSIFLKIKCYIIIC
jgi:hypothetical protein